MRTERFIRRVRGIGRPHRRRHREDGDERGETRETHQKRLASCSPQRCDELMTERKQTGNAFSSAASILGHLRDVDQGRRPTRRALSARGRRERRVVGRVAHSTRSHARFPAWNDSAQTRSVRTAQADRGLSAKDERERSAHLRDEMTAAQAR
jgi:hypothetical protein